MKKIRAISIIDDDPITVFGIKKMLHSIEASQDIITYGNGKEALDGIKLRIEEGSGVPEVIFLDINMPIMDGWQFLEEFIALPLKERIRINIVTSSIDPADKQNWERFKTRTHHLLDYKNKPIRRSDIAEITRVA
ncbi:response regulator [Lentiprolixibacter aurantiacus]|uniref:Response regulator n=1 Tax=Lentiprolixibacter aurantiacus TaxID=2993939 RepID=A0AAE3MKG4_9FLAO|nr:response regulator [Lentiprolixibacter aurantiacus]MCX2719291.1 response regulator [Lentiprolixibacter aurantiacus]